MCLSTCMSIPAPQQKYLYLKLCYPFHQEISCSEKGKFTERNFLSFFLPTPFPGFLSTTLFVLHFSFLRSVFPPFWVPGFRFSTTLQPGSPEGPQHPWPNETPWWWLWVRTEQMWESVMATMPHDTRCCVSRDTDHQCRGQGSCGPWKTRLPAFPETLLLFYSFLLEI